MKSYNGFTPYERVKGDKIIKKAIKEGRLDPPTKCVICGQTEGILHYHVEDYSEDKVLDDCRCYCWRCHMIHHSKHRAPSEVKRYFEEIEEGKKYPPVYRHDFGILKREHGIV